MMGSFADLHKLHAKDFGVSWNGWGEAAVIARL